MSIKLNVESEVKELAIGICNKTSRDELFKLIVEIALEVGDYNFDREMIDYFNYHQDILMSITEGSL
jgi:hypothetical protein